MIILRQLVVDREIFKWFIVSLSGEIVVRYSVNRVYGLHLATLV